MLSFVSRKGVNMKRILGVLAIVAISLAAKPAVAHHALQAEFDTAKRGEFTGTLTKFAMINPHVRWFFDVKKPDVFELPERAPDMRERLTASGYEPVGGDAAKFGELVRTELAKWSKVARNINLQRWTLMKRGGHFGLSENPDESVAEIRAFFSSLR